MDLLRQIPLIMGVLFIAIGVFHGWKLRSVVRRCTVYADGVVAGFHEVKTRSGVMYYPVIEFSVEHKKIRAEYKFGASEWEFKAGDKATLRYNAENPEEIYLYHSLPLLKQYLSPLCIIIGGLIFVWTYSYFL
uniref:DUF3592 domain-containing protein n=1 Tax=Megasphaera micronuciformis TaxID=187326 RepID=UPI00402691BC